jgi:hypothetical protein
VGDDPAYVAGGGDSLEYRIDKSSLKAPVGFVEATLYYQAIPPFYLQDRRCSARGSDTDRLVWLTEHLDLAASPAERWKLQIVTTGPIPLAH